MGLTSFARYADWQHGNSTDADTSPTRSLRGRARVSGSVEPPEGFRTRGSAPKGTRMVLIHHSKAYCNAKGMVGGPMGWGAHRTSPPRPVTARPLAARPAGLPNNTMSTVHVGVRTPCRPPGSSRPGCPGICGGRRLRTVRTAPGRGRRAHVAGVGGPSSGVPTGTTTPAPPVAGRGVMARFLRALRAGLTERIVARHPHELVVLVCTAASSNRR